MVSVIKSNLNSVILKWENLLQQNLKEEEKTTHRLNNWNTISFGVYPSNLFPKHEVYIFICKVVIILCSVFMYVLKTLLYSFTIMTYVVFMLLHVT